MNKDLMMKNWPPLTTPDGSKNTPERCPLYSRDSTQEDQEVTQEDEDEGLIVVKIEEEELYEMDQYNEDISPEINKNTKSTRSKVKNEDQDEGHVQIKEEEIPIAISAVGSCNRNTPERCYSPSSLDSTQNTTQKIPQNEKIMSGSAVYRRKCLNNPDSFCFIWGSFPVKG
ncbi:uncharacterized protein [Pyxicephalus adspersus]|uniref:uncharacterized protein isoform X2 n=1 Tax=Pyxicephalus adspersus TaxID=30357 RepID=UPI003B5CFAF4